MNDSFNNIKEDHKVSDPNLCVTLTQGNDLVVADIQVLSEDFQDKLFKILSSDLKIEVISINEGTIKKEIYTNR